MFETIYHIFITALCLFNGIVWNPRNTLNLIMKIVWWLGTISGIIMILMDFGYIVKV